MTNRVTLLRKSAKKTMKELSKDTGIGISTISSYENGYAEPKRENANILAEYFGVSVAYLLGYTDDPKPDNIAKTMTQAAIKSTISIMTPYRSDIERFSKEIRKKDFLDTKEQFKTVIDYGLEDYSPEFQRLFSLFLEESKHNQLKEFVKFLNNAHKSKNPEVKELIDAYEYGPEGRAYFDDLKNAMFGSKLNRTLTNAATKREKTASDEEA
ncbi:DNA-binding protein [Streptococcus suis]|uniref:DNA-binding protein n=1 Tax=Streptococcus suis TaxID=1307 RepID=A0A0Z8H8T0_STRSU|nr:helix-turn-helix transcriptional regulator [Streptococcus suis]NQH36323.1 helix-turn-helix transcriptional regulator [Streptococcus suis]CYV12661.1 DNA-binding protein [Streptococcus suis]